MNDLYTVNYKDEGPFFLSNFGQVTRCVRIHGVHNEEAIDRNTEAIIEQTEMQHAESDESQVQFSGHSMMLERESNETQNIMTAHTKMQKDESDETQEILRDGYTGVKNALTAHTNTMKNESDETQEKLVLVVEQLRDIAKEIKLNTSGTTAGMDAIDRAIQNLDLVVNNNIYNN